MSEEREHEQLIDVLFHGAVHSLQRYSSAGQNRVVKRV